MPSMSSARASKGDQSSKSARVNTSSRKNLSISSPNRIKKTVQPPQQQTSIEVANEVSPIRRELEIQQEIIYIAYHEELSKFFYLASQRTDDADQKVHTKRL